MRLKNMKIGDIYRTGVELFFFPKSVVSGGIIIEEGTMGILLGFKKNDIHYCFCFFIKGKIMFALFFKNVLFETFFKNV